ncbi:MAG: hypothetical protein ABSF69_25665 [Polyangiaceae bacterium]
MSVQVDELVPVDFHDIGGGHALVRVRLVGEPTPAWASLWGQSVSAAKAQAVHKPFLERSEPELKMQSGKIFLEYKTKDAEHATAVFKIIRDVLVPGTSHLLEEETKRNAEQARQGQERARQAKTNIDAITAAVIEESKRKP